MSTSRLQYQFRHTATGSVVREESRVLAIGSSQDVTVGALHISLKGQNLFPVGDGGHAALSSKHVNTKVGR